MTTGFPNRPRIIEIIQMTNVGLLISYFCSFEIHRRFSMADGERGVLISVELMVDEL
jgi:hypothetical protein